MGGLYVEDGRILNEAGQEVILRGINFAGDAKFPTREDSESYVDSPVPLDEADEHYSRLRNLGFNTLRYIYTWDALEHKGPGIYDTEYIDYTIEMVRKAIAHGFYVFMDPHQDVWSRFSGGSGAPRWTLEAVGFDTSAFETTHGAMLYNKHDETPRVKMLWASNYNRLVSFTMFTIFFAGEEFAPKCKINGENVGEYLHRHYIEALKHFMVRMRDADLGPNLIGMESLNEPGHGLIGCSNLGVLSSNPTHVKLHTAPTPFQAMLLGQGSSAKVDVYKFTALGVRKGDPDYISPRKPAWLDHHELAEVDEKYGWKRSWNGGCVWALHYVYDFATRELLQPYYFVPHTLPVKSGESVFVEHYFVKHWDAFYEMVTSISDDWLVFMQSPVNNPPPDLVGRGRPVDEKRVVYTPHYYDGLTLMLKRWRWMNVDAVGVMRERYATPALAVRLGARAVRASFGHQLAYIKREGLKRVGHVPCLISEIGIPYDMDDKRAYKTGYYLDQVRAMDANHYGLESSLLHHALWVYTACNTHEHGDSWCGEDLSIWSRDDVGRQVGDDVHEATVPYGLYHDGVRAAAAVIRPTAEHVHGRIESMSFDMYKAIFVLEIDTSTTKSSTTEESRIFLPSYYFGKTALLQHSGTIERVDQTVIWRHGPGKHRFVARGVTRFQDDVYSYVDPIVRFIDNIRTGAEAWVERIRQGYSSVKR